MKVMALALLFIALAIIAMAGISSLATIDASINQSALTPELADSYNFSAQSGETAFSIFSGSMVFLGIAFFFGIVAVCFAALRMR